MKVLKTIQATVPVGSARLMTALVLTVFFVSVPSLNAYADDEEDLRDAAVKGNISSVKALLDKGADVNVKNKEGTTALMFASMKGHIEIVKALLDKGADVNAQNKAGVTALMVASQEGQTEFVKVLLDKGADVNVKYEKGETALMFASEDGHTEIVKALLDKGADVNAQNKAGVTASMAALANSHTDVVRLLKKAEVADVSPQADDHVQSPSPTNPKLDPTSPAHSDKVTTDALLKRIDETLSPLSHANIVSENPSTGGSVAIDTKRGRRSDGKTITVKAVWRQDGNPIEIDQYGNIVHKEKPVVSAKSPNSYQVWLKTGSVSPLDALQGINGDMVIRVTEPTDEPAAQPLGYKHVEFISGASKEVYEFQNNTWFLKKE